MAFAKSLLRLPYNSFVASEWLASRIRDCLVQRPRHTGCPVTVVT